MLSFLSHVDTFRHSHQANPLATDRQAQECMAMRRVRNVLKLHPRSPLNLSVVLLSYFWPIPEHSAVSCHSLMASLTESEIPAFFIYFVICHGLPSSSSYLPSYHLLCFCVKDLSGDACELCWGSSFLLLSQYVSERSSQLPTKEYGTDHSVVSNWLKEDVWEPGTFSTTIQCSSPLPCFHSFSHENKRIWKLPFHLVTH